METGEYEASFTQDGKSMSALFTRKGVMTQSEESIKIAELPDGARAYLKKKYGMKAVKDAARITYPDNTTKYEAGIRDKDVIFDTDGKFLEIVKG